MPKKNNQSFSQRSLANALKDESAVSGDWDAAMVIDEEKCIKCGLCVKRCPVNAITMRRFAYSEE